MIINDLLEIVRLGARGPLVLVSEELSSKIRSLIPKIKDIVDSLEESEAKSDLLCFYQTLSAKEIDEYQLAQNLVEIAGVFVKNTPIDKAELIATFQNELSVFYRRAQFFHSYAQKRAQISQQVGREELRTRDKKLASTIGMMYVLEYLLLMYKHMDTSDTTEDKMRVVISRTVKLPEGEFPGLWFDFSADEILTKFILDIFNDELREVLVRSFYSAKDEILKIHVLCDLHGRCSAQYSEENVRQVQESLKQFIKKIIEVYGLMGIEELSSVFLVPYGSKSKLIHLPF